MLRARRGMRYRGPGGAHAEHFIQAELALGGFREQRRSRRFVHARRVGRLRGRLVGGSDAVWAQLVTQVTALGDGLARGYRRGRLRRWRSPDGEGSTECRRRLR